MGFSRSGVGDGGFLCAKWYGFGFLFLFSNISYFAKAEIFLLFLKLLVR